MGAIIKKQPEIRAILEKACSRREMLILVTPFLRFESAFITVHDLELSVLATMSREDAVYGLRSQELLIRFPQAMGFFEGHVQMLGLGLHDGKRTIRLTLPKLLKENDQRQTYRVERVGRVEVTFSTPKSNIYTASLVDVSITGARLHAQTDVPESSLNTGDMLLVDIPLNHEIKIQSAARVRHLRSRAIGIQFEPPLPERVRDPLSKWVFQRREEDRERLAQRLELGLHIEKTSPGHPSNAILLVSGDGQLEEELKRSLGAAFPMVRVPPTVQPLKDALSSRPLLLVFHVGSVTLDDRRRMKTLMEMVQTTVPVLILGTGVEGSALFDLANELKADSSMAWSASRAVFFQRLAHGMIRRHMDVGEVPLAPPEE